MIQRQTSLSANVVAFCRYLRTEGFAISVQEETDALRAIEILQPYHSAAWMRAAFRTVLARNSAQAQAFDALYDAYWKEVARASNAKIKEGESQNNRAKPKPKTAEEGLKAIKDWLFGAQDSTESLDIHLYSEAESLGRKDFSSLTASEIQAALEVVQMIARRLALRKSRRRKQARRGAPDLRRTLRLNLRRGGEIVEIARRAPRQERLQLVLLCDVSKSMELYSRFILQFAYAFQVSFRRIETFVFSTNLVRISDTLRKGTLHFSKMLDNLSEQVPGWSGGTRIGASLAQFTAEYASRYLNSKSVVVIVSDGWDTGDTTELSEAMQLIHRRANKVIWLNPLAGNPGFQPTAAGLAAALPYTDLHLAAHNIESLKNLERHLKR